MIRLDKYLADMGEGTRQEVKKQIRRGAVTVNGETVRSPERKVSEGDQVCLDGIEEKKKSKQEKRKEKYSDVVSQSF